MDRIVFITPNFAVTSELREGDFEQARAQGFKAILSNRPDGEADAPMTARQEAVLAWQAGLQFQHVPATKHDVFATDVVDDMEAALRVLDGPVLAHCKSGQRSAIIWAAASARSQTADCVLETLEKAGFDYEFLRDDLEQQADRRRWLTTPDALDCGCEDAAAGTNVVQFKTAAA